MLELDLLELDLLERDLLERDFAIECECAERATLRLQDVLVLFLFFTHSHTGP